MVMKRNAKRALFFFAASIAVAISSFLCAPALFAESGKASLTADRIEFDPRTNLIKARGNVHMTRPDGALSGDFGTGTTDGRSFEMTGNVRGRFEKEDLDIACGYIKLSTDGSVPPKRTIIASGDARLTRGDDEIASDRISWELDSEAYRASGNVLGSYEHYSIDSDTVSRSGEKFSATNIRKYSDKKRDFVLSAARADGVLDRLGEVVELLAEGGVVMDAPDEKGNMVRITGDKGLFSVARGTLVISGNSMIDQPGRNLHAESIVYHLDTERIEALGRPSLIMDIPD